MCPEYNDDLGIARALCDKAERELPQVGRLYPSFPGDFNVAASTVFGGSHAGTYAATSEWVQGMSEEEKEQFHPLERRRKRSLESASRLPGIEQ